MIKSLKIQNFQSHKKTQIKFSKGINLICGKTDSGKSSVRRALDWVISNKPSGDSFRSNWGGETKVEIKIKNQIIKRIKGNNKNEYFLNKNKYKSFGQNLPEDVSKLININPVNIQRQFDSVFLFSKSPGEVAKYLNRIIDIDIIDKSQSNISKEIRKEISKIQEQKQKKVNLKAELTSFKWIKDAERKIAQIEKLKEEIFRLKNTYINAQKNLVEIENLQYKKKDIFKTLRFKGVVESLIKGWNNLKQIKETQVKNQKDLLLFFDLRQEQKQIKARLENNCKILEKSLKYNCPLCGRLRRDKRTKNG